MNRPWRLTLSWPHDWRDDWSMTFETEDEAREYAKPWVERSKPSGRPGYIHIVLSQDVESLN